MNEYFLKRHIAAVFLSGLLIITGAVCTTVSSSTIRYDIQESNWDIHSLQDVSEGISQAETILENALSQNNVFTEIYGLSNRLLGKHETNQFTIVRDQSGQLFNGALYISHDANIPIYAKRVRRLKETAEAQGAKLLYISYPEKQWLCKNLATGLPLRDFSEIENEMLFCLAKNQVDSYSLLSAFQAPGVEQSQLYYRTDTALTSYGSFVAFQSILNELEQRFGVMLDATGYYSNPDNYDVTVYPASFLGNLGAKTGLLYSGTDDIVLRNPKKVNNYRWSYSEDSHSYVEVTCQELQSSSVAEELMQTGIHGRRMEDVYLNDMNLMDVIINEEGADLPKILCLRDASFSGTATYLAPLCSELHLMNVSASQKQVEQYLESHEFDYVLVGISASHISDHYFRYYTGK